MSWQQKKHHKTIPPPPQAVSVTAQRPLYSAEIKALFTEWIENRECTLKTKKIADKLIPLMEKCGCDICKQLLELRHSPSCLSNCLYKGCA